MYIKLHSYTLSRFGTPYAFIIVKMNPLSLKLKAEIEMRNGSKLELLSNGETNEQFEQRIEKEVSSHS
jgi:hypothetical protein